MTLEQLKAKVYDLLVAQQQIQIELNDANEKIRVLQAEEKKNEKK